MPVFTVAGACEDILLLERLRTGTYDIENPHIDEATTRCLDIGGIKLRLLGLVGAFVPYKMFDNGEGSATIAGGNGTTCQWSSALQISEFVETRHLITHAGPGREGVIASLALSSPLVCTLRSLRMTPAVREEANGDILGRRPRSPHGQRYSTSVPPHQPTKTPTWEMKATCVSHYSKVTSMQPS